ncbi:hypothetical protein [Rossellomorea vietnamensis]|uniref:hypothetical protein n=1 Tax=Rossellomorea vietnamensis TaxID=218284 RepID=UPI003CFA5FB2
MSDSFFFNSCIHSALVDTYVTLVHPTHVSILLLWIHMSLFFTTLMYPSRAGEYMSARFFLDTCIHSALVDTYVTLFRSTHVSKQSG